MKTIKKLIIPFLLLAILITGLIIYTKNLNPKQPEICINNLCFSIEIADTPEERQLGLMYRKQLPELAGMLFVFQQSGQYNFWMKNTLIPLDMIWINQDQKIIDIQQATPCTADPCPTYNPQGTSSYVLELNSGISEKYGIKIGDIVEINQ
ncbi:hypothetical protein P148_SR1C00001G0558 [candidate division SR1 bacterium RAAC1_SR1_1]|nr:hypothetical protein P148_SR1C00001G0558 [candidate division SR1 bacterium RAAC1_SR1_1]